MRGDFTRWLPRKQYTHVLKQQGRVDLDADWNAFADMREALARTTRRDLIGATGAPTGEDGFKIDVTDDGSDLLVSAGRIYVDGILCELQADPFPVRRLDDTRLSANEWLVDGKPLAADDWLEVYDENGQNHWYRIASAQESTRILTVDGSLAAFATAGPLRARRLLRASLQSDHPFPVSLSAEGGRSDVVYLEVWDRYYSVIEDPDLREKALGGADTTGRVKPVWQVKVLKDARTPGSKAVTSCDDSVKDWPPRSTRARLTVRGVSASATADDCELPATGGYRGTENRLYRVEIHDAGEPYGNRGAAASTAATITSGSDVVTLGARTLDARPLKVGNVLEIFSSETDAPTEGGLLARITAIADEASDPSKCMVTLSLIEDADAYDGNLDDLLSHTNVRARRVATYKWSRDNGAIAFPVEEIPAPATAGGEVKEVVVAALGPDRVLTIGEGDWVEVASDETEFASEPGILAQVGPIEETDFITLPLSKDVSGLRVGHHRRKVRRWDQGSDALPVRDGTLKLEQGIEVAFSGTDFRGGDYWAFAARTATGVEGLDLAPPHGIERHYARLAVLAWAEPSAGTLQVTVSDCRKLFPPLTGLPKPEGDCCTYTVGDGVSSVGDFEEIQKAVDALKGRGRVCILPGEHALKAPVVLRGREITLSGCGTVSHVLAPPGRPAFVVVEGSSAIGIESLSIHASAAEGAISAAGVRDLRVSDCAIVNWERPPPPAPPPLGEPVPKAEPKTISSRDGAGARGAEARVPVAVAAALAAAAASVEAPARGEVHEAKTSGAVAEVAESYPLLFTPEDGVFAERGRGDVWPRGLRKEERVRGPGKAAMRESGPAIALGACSLVLIEGNLLFGTPAISLQAEGARVRENVISGGGVWIRDGSASVLVENNDVRDGEGDGVLLGGLAPGEAPHPKVTGVSAVEIVHNRIERMAGSGVSSATARTQGNLALGDVVEVTIAHNRIADCVRASPGLLAADEAVGGIVLRETSRARVKDNEIVRNGAHSKTPASGVFAYLAEALEVAGNRVLGNGTDEAGAPESTTVDYAKVPETRDGPNPRTDGNVKIEVRDLENKRAGSTAIVSFSGLPRGLALGPRVSFDLPYACERVAGRIVTPVAEIEVLAYDADEREVARATIPVSRKEPQPFSLKAPGIARFVVRGPAFQATLAEFTYEASTGGFQGGIIALHVSPSAEGGARDAKEGLRLASAAARIHGNTVVAPQGHALLLVGLGTMTVTDNSLVSQGIHAQPGLVGGTAACVSVENLGKTSPASDALGAFGVKTIWPKMREGNDLKALKDAFASFDATDYAEKSGKLSEEEQAALLKYAQKLGGTFGQSKKSGLSWKTANVAAGLGEAGASAEDAGAVTISSAIPSTGSEGPLTGAWTTFPGTSLPLSRFLDLVSQYGLDKLGEVVVPETPTLVFKDAPTPEPRRLPEGRVLFHGNDVTLQCAGEAPELTNAAVALLSRDEVSLEGNTILAEIARGFLLAGTLALGANVRAAGNGFSELPRRTAYSYYSWGLLNTAIGNQAAHCILADGTRVVSVHNQVMDGTLCEKLEVSTLVGEVGK